jgi:hypothetical protein
MPIDVELDSQDPRVIAGMNLLANTLASFVGRSNNGGNYEAMQGIVDGFRMSFKREHGVDFPRLTRFELPSVGFIVWYRYDLEHEEIRRKVLMLLRQFAAKRIPITAIEVASAVSKAWPFYKPEQIIVDARHDPKGYSQYRNGHS